MSATPLNVMRSKRSSVITPDAVTVNPYLGGDSLEPFPQARGQGRDHPVPHLQSRRARHSGSAGRAHRKLYHVIAELAAQKWNSRGNCAGGWRDVSA